MLPPFEADFARGVGIAAEEFFEAVLTAALGVLVTGRISFS
jgi:hypothetical protein